MDSHFRNETLVWFVSVTDLMYCPVLFCNLDSLSYGFFDCLTELNHNKDQYQHSHQNVCHPTKESSKHFQHKTRRHIFIPYTCTLYIKTYNMSYMIAFYLDYSLLHSVQSAKIKLIK